MFVGIGRVQIEYIYIYIKICQWTVACFLPVPIANLEPLSKAKRLQMVSSQLPQLAEEWQQNHDNK